MKTNLNLVKQCIQRARSQFREQLINCESIGGLTVQRYHRFLSMQYHLTNGVQKHFFTAASHHSLVHRKTLRQFLIRFADEEESHYLIALKDLENLNLSPLPVCLDVKLWWAFFNSHVQERPFLRLGATCILENIAEGQGDVISNLMSKASYLDSRNTRFLVIHQHDNLPHGDQIMEALENIELTESEIHDLTEGADIGRILYLRLFSWVVTGENSF